MELYVTWLHILFFSTWLGANLFCLAIFLPASASLPPEVQLQARNRASHGLNTVTAASAPLVLVSGLAWFLSPGLDVSVNLEWSKLSITGIKFILTLAMIINHWLQAFRYSPRPGSLQDAHAPSDEAELAWKAWVRLLTINVILGFAIFLLGVSAI
jgi:uncharacterized membrane protein